jgi:Ca2+/H+ antiporter
MNRAEKEEYLREYAILKHQGKAFFPYAVLKDSVMAAIVLAVIIANAVTNEGESTWYEGLQLLAVYLVLALAFFFATQ